MRKREEISEDASNLADRDRIKIEVMLDLREILNDIREIIKIKR